MLKLYLDINAFGAVDVERFIFLVNKEPFDYTKL